MKRICCALVVAASVAAAGPACTHPSVSDTTPRIVAQGADSIPKAFWVAFMLTELDKAAVAMGLPPLRQTALREGEREIRVWSGASIAEPKDMLRFLESSGTVTGDFSLYFHDSSDTVHTGETFGELMRRSLGSRCASIRSRNGIGICTVRFVSAPHWKEVLRNAERDGLWTIPDETTQPRDGVSVYDGWSIIVELRDGARYRTYSYGNPDAHPTWPGAVQIMRVSKDLEAISRLMAYKP